MTPKLVKIRIGEETLPEEDLVFEVPEDAEEINLDVTEWLYPILEDIDCHINLLKIHVKTSHRLCWTYTVSQAHHGFSQHSANTLWRVSAVRNHRSINSPHWYDGFVLYVRKLRFEDLVRGSI